MPETPREYKKRIDEKWEKNKKNKERLLKKIEGYELLDKGFKEQTKKEILANFEKNQKAELEGEQYTTIVAELGKIDKKYEELEDLKGQLEAKKTEKEEIEKEIKRSKLDGADETTLKMQIAGVRKLKEKLETLRTEIKSLEKDIENREQEIKEIEDSYGEKVESEPESIIQEDSETEIQDEQVGGEPETLKEKQEQTIKELWKKDKTRKDIIKILDAGIGIDDGLKEKIKKEISDKFWVYYDEKQGSLSMKSARFVKNILKNKIRDYEKMNGTRKAEENEQKFNKIEKLADIFGTWYMRKSKLSDIIGINIEKFDMIMKAGGKQVYKAKDKNGKYHIIRGKELCGNGYEGYDEVDDVKYIGGKLVIKTKESGQNGYYKVFRGNKECYGTFKDNKDKYKKIYDIHELNGKPIFLALDSDGYYSIIIGYEKYMGDKNYTGSVAKGYYREEEIKEDLEKRQYINSSEGYKIIGWEK